MRKLRIHLVVLAISMLLGGFFAIRQGQDLNWDLYNYHFYNPHVFLEGKTITDIGPVQLDTYINPLIDVPGYLLITNFTPKQAGFALGLIQGINIWLIFEIGLVLLKNQRFKDWQRHVMAFGIAVVSALGAVTYSEFGGMMGDNIISLFILSSLWLLLVSLQAKPSLKPLHLRLLGFGLIGMAAGLKLTAAVYVVGLLVAALTVTGSGWREKLKLSIWHGLAVAGGMLVTGGFWYWKMWAMFKNPIFPLYNNIFKSSYFPETTFSDPRWNIDSLSEAVMRPFVTLKMDNHVAEVGFKEARFAIVFGLLGVLLAVWMIRKFWLKKKPIMTGWNRAFTAFWIFFLASYVVWLAQFGYYRYLFSLEILAPIGITILVLVLIKHRVWAATALAAIMIPMTVFTTAINWGRAAWQPTYFGVTKADFAYLDSSTVLVAGYVPFRFVLPYFPSSTKAIRVEPERNLTMPDGHPTDMQKLMRRNADAAIKDAQKLYALRSDYEQFFAEEAFNHFGFKTTNCQPFSTNYSQGTFKICELTKL